MDINQLLRKLQENLLSKSDQNKIMTKRLGLSTTIGRMYAKAAGIEMYDNLCNWTEDVQINMLGDSKNKFVEVMKDYKEPLENKEGG